MHHCSLSPYSWRGGGGEGALSFSNPQKNHLRVHKRDLLYKQNLQPALYDFGLDAKSCYVFSHNVRVNGHWSVCPDISKYSWTLLWMFLEMGVMYMPMYFYPSPRTFKIVSMIILTMSVNILITDCKLCKQCPWNFGLSQSNIWLIFGMDTCVVRH